MAKYARRIDIDLPVLFGRRLSTAEYYALSEVADDWTFSEGILVQLAERLDHLRWTVQKVFSKPEQKVEPPLHVPRKGEAPTSRGIPVVKASDLARMLRGGQ